VRYKDASILNHGDVSTLSFHATKLFHTVEGGAIVTNDDDVAHRISYMRNFGHKGQEEFWGLGVNGKSSEIHAAMGLCLLPRIGEIIESRSKLSRLYDQYLQGFNLNLQRPVVPDTTEYNYSYYPVIFSSEKELLTVKDNLNAAYIYPRRYFFPLLNTLPYLQERRHLPVAESISLRVLCLPLYYDLAAEDVRRICNIIAQVLKY
jgi:dTDP-4-amino-4,6-dideoxygalactose transaminase